MLGYYRLREKKEEESNRERGDKKEKATEREGIKKKRRENNRERIPTTSFAKHFNKNDRYYF